MSKIAFEQWKDDVSRSARALGWYIPDEMWGPAKDAWDKSRHAALTRAAEIARDFQGPCCNCSSDAISLARAIEAERDGKRAKGE